MQLNITTDYAIRLVLYLATVDRMAASQEIANAMKIPPKYITTVVSKLKEAGYVQTVQGSGGGYFLDSSPTEITLRDIVNATEGVVKINRCTECDPNCILFDGTTCPLNDTYQSLCGLIEDAFSNITIAELVHKDNKNEQLRNFARGPDCIELPHN